MIEIHIIIFAVLLALPVLVCGVFFAFLWWLAWMLKP